LAAQTTPPATHAGYIIGSIFMFRGSPSLLALLGMAAVAGLQNRQSMNGSLRNADPNQGGAPDPWGRHGLHGSGFGSGFGGVFPGGMGGGFVLDLGDLLAGKPRGAVVSGGLADLLRQFESAGHGRAAESWVSEGPNQPIEPDEVEQVISDDLLAELEQRTGLPRKEIVARLATGLPETVNQLTPQGRVPTEKEAEQFVIGPDTVELKEPGS
jgi:uncharacterized protein YidB (DUF937 family)